MGKNNFVKGGIPISWVVFSGLVVYSIILVVLTGDIGFQGDDWWVLSVPFWHGFPSSIGIYAQEFLRPIEGAYWIMIYELFGFHEIAFHFFSLLLLAICTLLMGLCLDKAFPHRGSFVAASMLFSFFFPAISSLTYVMHTDNSRLCMLFFWGSTLSFQRWASRKLSWAELSFPILLFLLSVLTYEAASLLVFCAPLLVWPILLRQHPQQSKSRFSFRLFIGVFSGFALFIFVRFAFLQEGAVGLTTIVPSFRLIWSYFSTLPQYILVPFTAISSDPTTWGITIVLFLSSCALLFKLDYSAINQPHELSNQLIVFTGICILILGMTPYVLAGYGAGLGFYAQNRIYSAASFGLAVLFGFSISAWRDRRLLIGVKLLGVFLIAIMGMFQLDLRKDWQEAARINHNLWTSFISQAPDVTPGTTFLFLDLQSYIGNRAVVFGGVFGLDEYIRILYHTKKIDAYYLYLSSPVFFDSEDRLAVVTPDGVLARGSPRNQPIPLNAVLIFQRKGDRLVLLDHISSEEQLAAIRWKGISVISSNPNRILPSPDAELRLSDICPLCYEH